MGVANMAQDKKYWERKHINKNRLMSGRYTQIHQSSCVSLEQNKRRKQHKNNKWAPDVSTSLS